MQITLKRGLSRHTNLSKLNGPATLMPATLCSWGLLTAVAVKVHTAAVWTDLSRLDLNTRSFGDLTADTIPVIDGLTRHYLRKLSCTHKHYNSASVHPSKLHLFYTARSTCSSFSMRQTQGWGGESFLIRQG